jgi:hypothetical protein
MKKVQFFVLMLFIMNTLFAQNNKYFTRNGSITFTSAAPMEKIISKNSQVNCILNTQTNDIAFKVVVKSFEFEKQAMADHFNNDYLQSDKFPNATFEGKITNTIDYTKNGKYDVTVDGKLTIHGVAKAMKQKGTIEIKDGKIVAKSKFTILLSDYGITVPNDYLKKISNTVELNIEAAMTPYVR